MVENPAQAPAIDDPDVPDGRKAFIPLGKSSW